MTADISITANAAREALTSLLDLVRASTRAAGSVGAKSMQADAQETVFMLTAAIVVADGKYEPGERAFVGSFIDWSSMAGGEEWFLKEYAARWQTASSRIPHFFDSAVSHDIQHGTQYACQMMREIELIAENVCVCDGRFAGAEHRLVQAFLLMLGGHMAQECSKRGDAGHRAARGWNSV